MRDGEREFRLAGGRALALRESGLLHPDGAAQRFTPYSELIHLSLDAGALTLGGRRGAWRLPRADFAVPGAASEALAALCERVAALPDGAAREERQRALDRRLGERRRLALAPALVGLTALLFLLSRALPALSIEGEYWGELGFLDEPWRLVTAQLLHEDFRHLASNALGLLLLGGLLERQLGAARTALVLASAGLGAMLGSWFAGYDRAMGASGLVAGVAGALLALELRRPDLVPAPWRPRRRLLVGTFALCAVLLLFVPRVAHAAHLGGFLAGGAVLVSLAPANVAGFAVGPMLRALDASLVALLVLALVPLGLGVLDPDRVAVLRAERLLAKEEPNALALNNYAWTLASSEQPSEQQLEVALDLARRAVRETRRSDANLLDTLAEVYFQIGRLEEALETIDEAIELAPGEPYFREQRRRFQGERARDDRPEPPEALPELPVPRLPGFDEESPGVRV
jgi:membrane associated rhomboid family serine protease